MKKLIFLLFIASMIVIAMLVAGCPQSGGSSGGGGGNGGSDDSNVSPKAIGWIGGGSNGWQTGNALGSGMDYLSFGETYGVYVDSTGNIYVADRSNNRICKWNKEGVSQGWIGGGKDGWNTGKIPGAGTDYKSFGYPCGVYVDSSGYIYIADRDNNRISKWSSEGIAQGWIGGGSNGWKTTEALSAGTDYQSFDWPCDVYVDSSGYIYIAEFNNHRISKWNNLGTAQGWIGGGSNGWKTTNGPSGGFDYQSFDNPQNVFVDDSGNIYIADFTNRISKWNNIGTALGWIGGGSNGWQTGNVPVSGIDYRSFWTARGMYIDSSGNIYVADSSNHRISKWNSAGSALGWFGGGSNGFKTSNAPFAMGDYQSFFFPFDIFIDNAGNIYIADEGNSRISKWK